MKNNLLDTLGITGPWKVTKSGNPHFALCIVAPDGGSVCHITQWITTQEGCAKAISKVPEMLRALYRIYCELLPYRSGAGSGDGNHIDILIGICKRTIEDATGKTIKEIQELLYG